MDWKRAIRSTILPQLCCFVLQPHPMLAQKDRLATINRTEVAAIRGNVHPLAKPDYDQGPADPDRTFPNVSIIFRPSAAQQAALNELLTSQQDPASQNYHAWLTPEEFADRFGLSQSDIDKISAWLRSEGFSINEIARSRTWIAFAGTAGQLQHAFRTQIREYLIAGERHVANATVPSVPAALAPLVLEITGLDDFRPKPALRKTEGAKAAPKYSGAGAHYLAPDDIATIYDLIPLYNAGYDGAGQSLVIAGQADIDTSDVEQFRKRYNLPDPRYNLPDATLIKLMVPGTIKAPRLDLYSPEDQVEAILDLEWSGAVARSATIYYIWSNDVFNSVMYAVEQNIAPVISFSYGACELGSNGLYGPRMQALAQQANVQGITWIAASGDSGAAGCDDQAKDQMAGKGMAVIMPASVPEVTGVGGTQFTDAAGGYWSGTNSSSAASAVSYIPETAWNETGADGLLSSGGGLSIVFPKPAWQAATGVPDANARAVPDVALAAAGHDGYIADIGGQTEIFAGTSLATPAFAGMVAILNQYSVAKGFQAKAGEGNINPMLYSLSISAPAAFHDITSGNNIIPCAYQSPDCSKGSYGYNAQPGYDLATGLGSVDATNLITQWNGKSARVSTATTLTATPANFTRNTNTVLMATVKAPAGAVFGGTISFVFGGKWVARVPLTTNASGVATAGLTVSGGQLDAGPETVSAIYSGTLDFIGSSASTTITAIPVPGTSAPNLFPGGIVNAADDDSTLLAPGSLVAIYGTGFTVSEATASTTPLPTTLNGVSVTFNGIPAPLLYVSPSQINAQIPLEVTDTYASVIVSGPTGMSNPEGVKLGPAAPGLFSGAIVDFQTGKFVNATAPAHGGDVLTIYAIGLGPVSPQPATGAAASTSALSSCTLPVTLAIGGVQVKPTFAGLAPGFVGFYQINVTIPSNARVGDAVPVTASVGGALSNMVNIPIQ